MSLTNLRAFCHRREKLLAVAAVILAIAIFATICATQIGRWSVWFDESFTAYMIKFNFADIAKWTSFDVHPPLFYWLLKIWAAFFGHSDVALRSFSVFCGGLVILLGFLLSRKLFGKKVGYLTLPLLAISPMLLRYGIEMRMYALAVVIVFAQILVLIKAREVDSNSLRKWWVFYGVLLAAGMWTHYFTALAVLAQWLWLYFGFREPNCRGKKLWRKLLGFRENSTTKWQDFLHGRQGNFLWSLVVAAVLFSPWLYFMVIQLTTVQTAGFWIPPVSFTTLPDYISSIFLYQTASAATSWLTFGLILLLIILIILFAKTWRQSQDDKPFRENLKLILFVIIAPPLLLIILSMPPLQSSFIDRYILASMILVTVLVTVIVARNLDFAKMWRAKVWPIFLYFMAVAAFVGGIFAVVHFGNYNKTTNTVSTAKQLMAQISAKTGDQTMPVIADTPWVFYDANVYASQNNPVYFLNDQADSFYYGSLFMLRNAPENIKNLDQFIANMSGDKVWYISSSGGAATPPKDARGWQKLREIYAPSPFDGNTKTQAVEYLVK